LRIKKLKSIKIFIENKKKNYILDRNETKKEKFLKRIKIKLNEFYKGDIIKLKKLNHK
jgi:UDP-glucose 4-epimerase